MFYSLVSFLWRLLPLALLWSAAAYADLPVVEGPKSAKDQSFYSQIAGYLNDGIVLGGLILAAVSMLTVGNAIITTFAEVRDGRATWAKFGMLCVVGVLLIVVVVWLASKAATILL